MLCIGIGIVDIIVGTMKQKVLSIKLKLIFLIIIQFVLCILKISMIVKVFIKFYTMNV